MAARSQWPVITRSNTGKLLVAQFVSGAEHMTTGIRLDRSFDWSEDFRCIRLLFVLYLIVVGALSSRRAMGMFLAFCWFQSYTR